MAHTEPASSGSGESFVYDKQQLHAIAEKWSELAMHFRTSAVNATAMAKVDGPGAEYASGGHAVDANISGAAYSESIKASEEYCTAQVAKYRKVLGEVVDADEEGGRKLQQSTSPLDGGI